MAAGDTGNFAGALQEIIADAIVSFRKANVCMPLVTVESRPKADQITFPVWNRGSNVLTSSDVGTHSESDATAISATQLDSDKKTLTLDMYSVRVPVHDEAVYSNADDISGRVGALLGNALAAKVDLILATLFDGFGTSVADTTNGISIDDIFSALGTLNNSSAPAPFSMVHHPQAIWGTYGLSNDLVTSNQFGGSPSLQDDMLRSGFVGQVAGIDVYSSPEVPESGTTDAKGAIFSKEALGFGWAGSELFNVEVWRAGDRLKTDYIGSMFAAGGELVDAYGIEMYHKVA